MSRKYYMDGLYQKMFSTKTISPFPFKLMDGTLVVSPEYYLHKHWFTSVLLISYNSSQTHFPFLHPR